MLVLHKDLEYKQIIINTCYFEKVTNSDVGLIKIVTDDNYWNKLLYIAYWNYP